MIGKLGIRWSGGRLKSATGGVRRESLAFLKAVLGGCKGCPFLKGFLSFVKVALRDYYPLLRTF